MVGGYTLDDLRIRKPQKKDIPSVEEGIHLFISYDLVNSTKLKTLCLSSEWQDLIGQFYKRAENMASNPLEARIWKYIGDEVIVYKIISDRETLCETVNNASIALKELGTFVRNWESKSVIRRNLLSVKCAAWCALINNSSQEANRCMILQTSVLDALGRRSEQYIPDFIGPDIDIGFRIAKYADRGRMILSSDLALLVLKCAGTSENKSRQEEYCLSTTQKMKIVSFKQLKGVWHDRHYPIIWYEKSWLDIGDSFEYDEPHSSDVIKGLHEAKDGLPIEISALTKVYEDIGAPDKVNVMTEMLQRKSQQRISENP